MKVTGIELLQKIDKDEIKELQKVNVLSPRGEIYSKCYYKNGDLLIIDTNEDLMDSIKLGGLNYYYYEIIEEPKEELEKIELIPLQELVNEKANGLERLLAIKINELIANQNKIIRKMKKKNE